MSKIEINYVALKNAKDFEYADNREGVSCRLVPIEEAREQDKKLKLFEIIKNKNVDVGGIKHAIKLAINNKATLLNAMTKEFVEPYIYYNASRSKSEWLTQEEFNLLKEVLLWVD